MLYYVAIVARQMGQTHPRTRRRPQPRRSRCAMARPAPPNAVRATGKCRLAAVGHSRVRRLRGVKFRTAVGVQPSSPQCESIGPRAARCGIIRASHRMGLESQECRSVGLKLLGDRCCRRERCRDQRADRAHAGAVRRRAWRNGGRVGAGDRPTLSPARPRQRAQDPFGAFVHICTRFVCGQEAHSPLGTAHRADANYTAPMTENGASGRSAGFDLCSNNRMLQAWTLPITA
jgi:hypothetical protein